MKRMLATFALVATALAQSPAPQRSTYLNLAQGAVVNVPNTAGSQAVSFEYLFSATPAAVSITIAGCMRGTNPNPGAVGTCDAAADTYTGTTNSIRSPSFTKVYDTFQLTVGTLSGATVTINTTIVVSKAGTGSGSGGGATGGSGAAAFSPTQPSFLVTASPYNAKCDGSTNDAAAIQAAEAAAEAAGTGGTLIFPTGQCNVGSTLNITGTNIRWVGQGGRQSGSGTNGTVIMMTSASADILDITGSNSSFPSSYLQTVQIQNMGFRRSVSPTSSSNGIRIQYCLNCKIDDVESWDSVNNYFSLNVNNLFFSRTWAVASSISGASADLVGYNISGNANSTVGNDMQAGGTATGFIGKGMLIGSGSADMNFLRFQTNSQTNIGLSVEASVEDVYFEEPILDACPTSCLHIVNSNSGALGVPNQITIEDCHCLGGTTTTPANVISNSSGVELRGGYYICRVAGCNALLINATGGASSNIVVDGIQALSNAGTNNSAPIGVSGSTNVTLTGNTVFAPSGVPFVAGIALVSGTTKSTVTGNVVLGFGTECYLADATSSGNVFAGNICDTTNVTTAVRDQSGGNTYTSTTLAPGIIGDAFSYKSTATITGPVPVKWDTSNANQVVQTITTDTGAGIPVGVCANSPAAGDACLVMTHGTAALKLGTGTCAIGNFAIVDTTTNGDMKCTGTYSAGTVIGTAQIANSTVGTASNVMIGLR